MIVHRMEESEKKASQTRKLIASINISPGGWADVLRCWCLYLRWMARTMDIPNCYSFIKLRPIVSPVISPAYEEDLKGIDAEAGDISPDYFPFLSSSILLNRTTIETPKADSSMSRKARSENQINRVYYVIVFHPRTFLFKRSRFRWKLFSILSSSSSTSSSHPIDWVQPFTDYLIDFPSAPIILRVIYINQ